MQGEGNGKREERGKAAEWESLMWGLRLSIYIRSRNLFFSSSIYNFVNSHEHDQ